MHPRNTDHATRIEIIERHLAGETLANLAEALQLNFYTVRNWWRISHRQGLPGLFPKPAGPPGRGVLSKFEPLVKYVVLRLKRHHPAWGLDVLRLELKRRPSLRGIALPQRT